MKAARKKLIEVALPLDAIDAASAREKSVGHGRPSTLHLWWARRPLAACRAALFAQPVDDPSSLPDEFPGEAARDRERRRLFRIPERLAQWENSNNPRVIGDARREIARSAARGLGVPAPQTRAEVVDPFCGGGSIPLEAQRLGLRARGSDLNPVAVSIARAPVEIPPRFAGMAPVNPEARARFAAGGAAWSGAGAEGLAEVERASSRAQACPRGRGGVSPASSLRAARACRRDAGAPRSDDIRLMQRSRGVGRRRGAADKEKAAHPSRAALRPDRIVDCRRQTGSVIVGTTRSSL